MWATCHTDGCENAGVPIDVGDLERTDEDTGETIVAGVVCGPCGQPIDDLSDTDPGATSGE